MVGVRPQTKVLATRNLPLNASSQVSNAATNLSDDTRNIQVGHMDISSDTASLHHRDDFPSRNPSLPDDSRFAALNRLPDKMGLPGRQVTCGCIKSFHPVRPAGCLDMLGRTGFR